MQCREIHVARVLEDDAQWPVAPPEVSVSPLRVRLRRARMHPDALLCRASGCWMSMASAATRSAPTVPSSTPLCCRRGNPATPPMYG